MLAEKQKTKMSIAFMNQESPSASKKTFRTVL
jgi:hypothetical protein